MPGGAPELDTQAAFGACFWKLKLGAAVFFCDSDVMMPPEEPLASGRCHWFDWLDSFGYSDRRFICRLFLPMSLTLPGWCEDWCYCCDSLRLDMTPLMLCGSAFLVWLVACW